MVGNNRLKLTRIISLEVQTNILSSILLIVIINVKIITGLIRTNWADNFCTYTFS